MTLLQFSVDQIMRKANTIRCRDLRMINRVGLGHIGSDLSVIDILATLYFGVLRIDPHNPDNAGRNRIILTSTESPFKALLTTSSFQ